MNANAIAVLIGVVVLLVIVALVVRKKRPKRLKVDKFTRRWKELQSYCKDKATWPKAIIEADKLLDNALKRRRFSGKSMGERIVSAQRTFTMNDAVWYAHNLCKKILADDTLELKEKEVKAALVGFRQALRDIGALANGESDEA